MLCKGTEGPVKGNVIGLHYVSEYQNTNFELFFVKFQSVLNLHQLSLKLGLHENYVSCPDFPTLNVLQIDFYSQMGSIHLPVSLCSLTINCVTLEEKESQTIADYLSSTTCLKELKLNFCSDIMKMEPILRAMATNNLLPLKRVELKCERCKINKTAYEYLLSF